MDSRIILFITGLSGVFLFFVSFFLILIPW